VSRLRRLRALFKNSFSPGVTSATISSNCDGIRLHLGCGRVDLPGWVNIDAIQYPHVHLVDSNLEFNEFADSSLSMVYMSHILEHFTNKQSAELLYRIHKKLNTGGLLIISVPSFDSVVRIYQDNGMSISGIMSLLLGGQDTQFNYHKSIYNSNSLALTLKQSGYNCIQNWDTFQLFGRDVGDWSSRSHLLSTGESVPLSCNLMGIKQDVL